MDSNGLSDPCYGVKETWERLNILLVKVAELERANTELLSITRKSVNSGVTIEELNLTELDKSHRWANGNSPRAEGDIKFQKDHQVLLEARLKSAERKILVLEKDLKDAESRCLVAEQMIKDKDEVLQSKRRGLELEAHQQLQQQISHQDLANSQANQELQVCQDQLAQTTRQLVELQAVHSHCRELREQMFDHDKEQQTEQLQNVVHTIEAQLQTMKNDLTVSFC
jgi:hypothetical protein